MTCVICQTELVEEVKTVCQIPDTYGPIGQHITFHQRTGYSICPKCRLVYREGEK